MERHLKKLPERILDLIYLARDVSAQKGSAVYLVGGCVRDLLLGQGHFDLDIMVDGDAISFADAFAAHLKNIKVVHHRKFGTATVHLSPNLKVDFATCRKEHYPHPAALPEVCPSCLKDDLFRRDFTVNAIAVDITARNFGQVMDLFGGKEDLKKGLIRAMHENSFVDDPTRIFRAVRFEQRLGFRIEPRTLEWIKRAAKGRIFAHLKPSRTTRELELILKEKNAVSCLRRLDEICALKVTSDFFHAPIDAGKWQERIHNVKAR